MMKPLDDLKVLSPEEQVALTLAQDARRVRWLTRTMLMLWVVASGIAVALFLTYWVVASPVIKKQKDELGIMRLPVGFGMWPADAPQAIRARVEALNALYLTVQLALIVAITIGILAVSSLITVLLVRATQRATLRQIQASLADISKQLAEIKASGGA